MGLAKSHELQKAWKVDPPLPCGQAVSNSSCQPRNLPHSVADYSARLHVTRIRRADLTDFGVELLKHSKSSGTEINAWLTRE